MLTHSWNTLSKKASAARRSTAAAIVALRLLVLGNPSPGYAQQTINAQALTAEGIALTPADFGPEWSVAAHDTRTLEDGSHLSFHASPPRPVAWCT